MANKTPLSVNYQPQPVPRPAGMTDGEYRDYVRRMQGEQARSAASQQGLNTSGMYWDGSQFKDADERHWYSNPSVLGPLAVTAATFGAASPGLFGLPASVGSLGQTVAPGVVNLATPASNAAAAAFAPSAAALAPVGTLAPGVVNLATPASNAAAAAIPPAASGGGGLAGVLRSLTSGQNLPSLIGLGTTLAAGGFGGGGNGPGNDELSRIRAITEARMRRVDPLHQAITSLAMSRLPTNMQRPVPDVPLPEQR